MLRRSFLSPFSIRSTSTPSLSSALVITHRRQSTMPLPNISLTPNEERLANLLVACADWVDANPHQVDALRLKDEQGEWIGKLRSDDKVELRIAGGWVRDKLLGKESDDIDISTSPDPITGLKFATLFEKYLEAHDQSHLMGKLTKIEAKPEQSKHLETATARVCDLSVDWVQQRGQEVYSPGSRIPTVAFGSPIEDAERRDLTINALFYNLRTQQIEDQTGRGLSDLGLQPPNPKRIRTPLEPFQTFKDDPLRIVRAVRFAARFGREFELDDEMVRAIEREEIRQALLDPKKISRERVGAELDKMLLGRDPDYAFELIERLHLHPLIFLYDHAATFPSSSLSTGSPPPPPDTATSVYAAKLLTSLLTPDRSTASSLPELHPLLQLHVVSPPPLAPHSTLPPYPEPVPLTAAPSSSSPRRPPPLATIYPHTLKRLYLSCGLLPLYALSTTDKKKVVWVGEKIVRDGIKGPTIDATWSKKLRDAWELVSATTDLVGEFGRRRAQETAGVAATRSDAEDRVKLGMLLRNPSIHDGQHVRWNVSLFWSLVVDLVHAQNDLERQAELIESYSAFVDRILELKLDSLAFSPPLLDGNTINDLLPVTKSSPAMVQILVLVLERQLAEPDTTKDEMVQWLMTDETTALVEGLCRNFKRPAGTKRKGGQ
ncbi:hypothetical protein JCM11491_005667 [Sporobolomyces phaffii]